MFTRLAAAITLTLATLLGGCGKSDGSGGSGQASSASLGGKGLESKDVEARLKKAGWTITSSEPDSDLNWPSLYMHITKGEGDKAVSATVWVDALSESSAAGAPAPQLVLGDGALLRFGWAPGAAKKPAPDLAAYAKDISPIEKPENATDNNLFTNAKYQAAVTKWGLKNDGSRGGGRVSPSDVVYNHRFLDGDAGTLCIEIVHYKGGVQKGEAKLVGTTLVAVQADDEATKKSVYDALSGG